MKNENRILVALTGLLSIFSSAAIAGAPLADDVTPKTSQPLTLEKAIRQNTEHKLAAEAQKYSRIAALAGNRQGELEKRRDEAASTHKIWRDLKSAVEIPRNANPDGFRAIEVAAQAYSRANKAFIDLQKDILAKNGVSPDAANTLVVVNGVPPSPVDTFNAAPPTAAGSR